MDRPEDLDPAEHPVHRVLSAVPPEPPPLGFRDAVMGRLRRRRAVSELVLAAAMAVPSAIFLAWQALANGGELTDALANAVAAAQGTQSELFVVIDGVLVIAAALIGGAGVLAADALLRREGDPA